MHSKINLITDAFRADASGYITEDVTGEKLVECLETVTNGEYYMDKAVTKRVFKNILMTEEDRDRT